MLAPRIVISFLGPWEFRVDGRTLPRPSTLKAQSLLAYTIVHGKSAHSREKLAALFWPDADDDRAQRSLRTALWSVRRLLTDAHPGLAEALVATRFDVRWAPVLAVEIDVEQFEGALAQWRQARHDDLPSALVALQTAIALYRGPLLEGLYDDWCLDERYRLEEHYLGAVEAAVIALEAGGQIREAMAHAQRLLAVDPVREEVHCTVLRLLGILGDRSGLMRQYQRCKEILFRELDELPSAETEATLAAALQTIQARQIKPLAAPALAGAADAPLRQSGAPAARRRVDAAEIPETQPRREAAMPVRSGADSLPFVGRDAQWQTLIDWLARAEAGEGHTILVAGEAGSGKTRLLEEVTARARWRSMRVLWGTCYEYERVLPYQPFAEALRNSLQPTSGPLVDDRGRAAPIAGSSASDAGTLAALPLVWQQALLLLLPDWADRLADKPPVMQGASQDQAHLLEGIGQYLQALAARQPLVLAIDDLQWAATSTLQLFHHIARIAPRYAILLIGSYRPEDLPEVAHHARADGLLPVPTVAGLHRGLGKDGILDTVTLDRLTEDDVARLARELPGLSGRRSAAREAPDDAARSGALADRLYRFTEGNPLFLAAAVQALREDGALDAAPPDARWPLPARIRDLLQERVERVSPLAREAARVAAVAGCEFDMAVLQRAWGRDEEDTLRALDDLLANRLVKEVSSRGARDFAFSHHLLQEAIYQGLPQPVRARTHGMVAEAMQEIYSPRMVAAELSFHFEQAGLLAQAIVHAKNAGAQAAASFANQDADQHYSQALAYLHHEKDAYHDARRYDEQRFDLLAARLSVRQRIGMPEREMSDVAEMLAIAHRLHDARREVEALLERSALESRAGQYAESQLDARDAVGRARLLTTATDGSKRLLQARAAACLGIACFHQDTYEKAVDAYRQALAAYRDLAVDDGDLGDDVRLAARRGEADVLDRLGRVYQQLGDYQEARRHHAESLAIARAGQDTGGEASALNNLGGVSWFAGDLDGAQNDWEAGLSLERRMGHRHGEGTQLRNLGLVFWRRRDFERALAYLRDALAIFEELQEPGRILECYQGLGDIRYLVGPLTEARAAYQQALALAQSMGSSQKVAQSLFGCARANRSLGQPADAMEHIAAARALCRTIDWPRGIAWCNREEGMARLDLGDAAAARDLLQAALDGFLALGEPGFVAATQAELACAYLALREPATARALAEQAATAVGADRYGIDQPQTILFTLYRSLAALGDRAGAREALAAAVAEIEEQAHRSRDPALRDSFRRTVPINREIVAALDDSRGRR